jgi:hypothetical protein
MKTKESVEMVDRFDNQDINLESYVYPVNEIGEHTRYQIEYTIKPEICTQSRGIENTVVLYCRNMDEMSQTFDLIRSNW